MPADAGTEDVRSTAVPVVLAALLAAGAQIAVELSLPTGGTDRRAALASGPEWTVRFAAAAVLCAAACWLVHGVVRDRQAVVAPDDHLTSRYLATAGFLTLVSTFGGAVPGAVISVLVFLAIPLMRHGGDDPNGRPTRDAQTAAFVAFGASLLLVVGRQSFGTYLRWSEGYGVTDRSVDDYIAAHHGTALVLVLQGLATAAALLVPLTIWRHRRSLRRVSGRGLGRTSVRRLYIALPLTLWAAAVIASNRPVLVIGVLSLVLVLMVRRGSADQPFEPPAIS